MWIEVKNGYVSIPREDSCFWELRMRDEHVRAGIVSIPREDSCFWERYSKIPTRAKTPSFNPQRGFMLLGTSMAFGGIIHSRFQSPERIHAFGNVTLEALMHNLLFQSPERIHAFGNRVTIQQNRTQNGFNPQRGFMLLGTPNSRGAIYPRRVSIPREDSCFWEQGLGVLVACVGGFQSPERIHAFGNFLEVFPMLVPSFNPQRGFMLLGTLP